jgi:cell division protein FtsQ
VSRRAPRSARSKKKDPRPSTTPVDNTAPKRSRGARSTRSAPSATSKRAKWARRTLVVALVGVTLYVAGNWTLHRSFLSVHHVQARGLHHESLGRILLITGLGQHPAMIDVNDEVIERRIERLTWVRSATVTKRWPSTIDISVRERVAVAVVYVAQHRVERLDATGHPLGTVTVSRNLPLLEIVGRPIRSPWTFAAWSRSAAVVAGALPRVLQAQVAAVRVTRSGSVSLRLTTPLTFILGTPTQLAAKFESVAAVIKASSVNNVTLRAGDVIDVSVPGTLTLSGR